MPGSGLCGVKIIARHLLLNPQVLMGFLGMDDA
jgi:hypothetical protein